jgi:hypothetical protein
MTATVDTVLGLVTRLTEAALKGAKPDTKAASVAEQVIQLIEARGDAKINAVMAKAREAYGLKPSKKKGQPDESNPTRPA